MAVTVAAISTAVAVIGGHSFGRFHFKNTLLSVRVLPTTAVLIPYFVILSALHLVGTYAGLIVTCLTTVVPLLTWVLMGYFGGLPLEMERPLTSTAAAGCVRCGMSPFRWQRLGSPPLS